MKLFLNSTNQLFKYLLGILVIFASFVIAISFPKYNTPAYAFIAVYLLELYIWSVFCKWVNQDLFCKKIACTIINLAATIFFILFAAVSCFYSFKSWSTVAQSAVIAILTVLILPKILLGFCLLINELIYFISRKRIKYINLWVKISFGFALLIFCTLIYGIFFTRHHIDVSHREIYVENLPKEFNNLKIVQFSDIHLGGWYSKTTVQKAVKLINEQHADVVFFTGDLVTLTSKETIGYDTILSKIKSKFGVYSILGNHDYGGYVTWTSQAAKDMNFHELIGFQEQIGWKLLLNKSDEIKIGNSHITICGVENWGKEARFPKLANINKALSNVDTTNSIVLLLCHDPSYWDYAIKDKYTKIPITFSGHTHGMQVGVRLSKNSSNLLYHFFSHLEGLYQNSTGTQKLLINRGIGSVGYPGRIGLGPEISVITLKSSY